MRFSANMNQHAYRNPGEPGRLLSVTDGIGKKTDPLDLKTYLYSLVHAGMEFALDCGIKTEDAQQALDDLRTLLQGVRITSEPIKREELLNEPQPSSEQ